MTDASANVLCKMTAGAGRGGGGAASPIAKPGQRLEPVLSSAVFNLAMWLSKGTVDINPLSLLVTAPLPES